MATKKGKLIIHSIRVLPLYGGAQMFESLKDALSFVKEQPETGMISTLQKPLKQADFLVE